MSDYGRAAVALSGVDGEAFDALFALRLRGCTRRSGASGARALLGGLWDPRSERVFELRVLWDREEALAGRGGTSIYLLGRVRCEGREAAKEAANRLASEALGLLRGAVPCQAWEFVVTDVELDAVLQPFLIADAVELVRKQEDIRIEGVAASGGPEDAYGGMDSQDAVLHMRPPEGVEDPLGALSRAALCTEAPLMLSVAWAPTRAAQVELAAMRRDQERCRLLIERHEARDAARELAGAARREVAQVLGAHLSETARGLEESAFLVKAILASPVGIREATVRAAMEALFGSASSEGGAPGVLVPFRSLRGGGSAHRLAGRALEGAARRLSRLDVRSDLMEQTRGRHLLPIAQAASLLPLPLRAGNGVQEEILEAEPRLPETPAGTPLGIVRAFGGRAMVRLGDEDRARHAYLVGATGCGKTTTLAAIALDDIRRGRGVTVLDPHGDLVRRLLSDSPERRRKDIVFVNLADRKAGHVLNLLECANDEERDFTANYLIELFEQMYDMKECGGPVFEMYFRAGLLLAMTGLDRTGTLADVVDLFSSKKARHVALGRCQVHYVVRLWADVIEEAGGETALANVVPYVISKLSSFLYNSRMREILSSPKSTVNVSAVMQERKILLVDLSKGALGESASRLLGGILAGQILRATMRPSDDVRQEHFLFVDEFHSIAAPTFATMLAESRKFGLRVSLADQSLGQLGEKVRGAVLGNVGSLLAFRLGPADAELLKGHFAPEFDVLDLMRLPVGKAVASLSVGGGKGAPVLLECQNQGEIEEMRAVDSSEDGHLRPNGWSTHRSFSERRRCGGMVDGR